MKLTLQIKILLITIAIIILSISANSVINSVIFVNEYTNVLGEKSFAVGQSLKIQLDRLLRLNIPLDKLVGFEKQCSDLVNTYDDILYAAVLDTNNIILFHNDMSQHGRKLYYIPKSDIHSFKQKFFELKNEASETIYQSRIPIIDSHKEYQGMVIIGFSDEAIKAKRNRMIFASVLIGVFSVAFAACLVVSLIHLIVSKPLNKFISDIQLIRSAKADELQLIKSRSNDEIGQLKKAFNDLMADLNASNNKIKKYTEQLESEIQARTAELTIANQKLQHDMIVIKETDKALKKSEFKYRSMMESMTDPVYICSPDFKVEYMNPAMINRIGRNAVGEPCHSAIHGKNKKCDWCVFDKVAKNETIETTVLSPLDKRNYRQIHMPIVHRDGTVSKMSLFRDITDLLIAVEEKEKAKAQLLQSQKMESIGTLAGGIAHDFNNLMTTVIGNAHLVLMLTGKDDPVRKKIEAIEAAGGKAADLTRQILAFSRKQMIQPKVLDINEVLTDIKSMLVRLVEESIEMKMIYEPALWPVKMDPSQINQIVINLVTNARDAMPAGGKLTIETANANLDENYFREHGVEKQPGSYVMLSVSDTGIGMDKETLEHIFEPFYTTKEVDKGTGLGLSTVYGVVKQNKGFVWVDSEPGQGSTFKIYLPVTKGDPGTKKKDLPRDYVPKGSENILIVEDDLSVRKLICEFLDQYGYQVLEAENGEKAIKIAGKHNGPIHLLITDVVMPKMSGREVADNLKSHRPEIKVLYISGYTDRNLPGFLEEGANFLKKPFSPEVLAHKVREALDS
ncbi:MAG: ATP-binding protein [Desulfobacterales bacterium]|nr:ATP-binding protein [Desulfobacterales bacterium]